MKTSWPRVECRVTRLFDAEHSLPQVGNPERHRHSYWLECGYFHEINPIRGVTKSMQEMLVDVDEIVARLRGQYLNDVLPVTPTAEFLACWILAQLSEYWDFVVIRAYNGFECKAERKNMTKEWLSKLRGQA